MIADVSTCTCVFVHNDNFVELDRKVIRFFFMSIQAPLLLLLIFRSAEASAAEASKLVMESQTLIQNHMQSFLSFNDPISSPTALEEVRL